MTYVYIIRIYVHVCVLHSKISCFKFTWNQVQALSLISRLGYYDNIPAWINIYESIFINLAYRLLHFRHNDVILTAVPTLLNIYYPPWPKQIIIECFKFNLACFNSFADIIELLTSLQIITIRTDLRIVLLHLWIFLIY